MGIASVRATFFIYLFSVAAVVYVCFEVGTASTKSSAATALSLCFITTPNMTVAENIAASLVTKKLAACVNIVPGVTSVYEWQGTLEKSQEHLLIAKTRTQLIEALISDVKKNHPYEVPEIISTPLGPGSAEYLKWVLSSTDRVTS